VDSHGVKEQLLYEIGDPKSLLRAGLCDGLHQREGGRSRGRNLRAGKRRDRLGTHQFSETLYQLRRWLEGRLEPWFYTWPGAQEKAREADRIVRRRIGAAGLEFDEIYTEFLGVNASHGAAAPPVGEVPELQLRIGVRGRDRAAVERFTRELIPLVLSGPPGATGYGEGRPPVREIVSYWLR